ncbi:glycine/D-amino acid oxidase-like deaminating enzyme [Thermocatellispora tengchongensis]|uniref:Glycine/D-amino acid oxidase-like deaminating enzyme n=1 Tax=Thermocatellispora tengchongensis TaxID=1073253 RepID=A0A840PPB0_9ACTN|nr:FAD-dependent oxidoreductase [Thermocatellispora tengchongensis]MBB5139550.1 glycine/D-amino acid oxidase-like deaminating enzyme [Thermocatellispora tengchongensis]
MNSAIVVGAGIWGTSVALRLADTGWDVTLVEQHGFPGHLRQASAGETRLLRCAHGGDEWYARLAWRARDGWRALERRAGEDLYLEAGLVWFAHRMDGAERLSTAALERAGVPYEVWDPDRLATRFPDVRVAGLAFALWEPHAGVLRARRAVQVTAGLARDAGVRLVTGRARPGPDGEVVLGGDVLRADRVVWACGAWLPRAFPDLAATAGMTVTRQDTLHFAAPGEEWRTPPTPAWIDYDASAYGHGDVDGAGLKATSDAEGEPFDPEGGERLIAPGSERAARAYLRTRFPALAAAPVQLGQVCQYALTPDAEWIITEVSEGTWVLGGDSGHGFKHAPALAAYVAGLLEGEYGPEPRFAPEGRTAVRGLRTSGSVM